MYVDRSDEGEYEVSLGFPLPNRLATGTGVSGNSPGGNTYTIVTKKAESIPVAVRKIRSDLSREVSWGHCRVVVVGRKMAEKGIKPLLEFTSREPNLHTKTYLFVSPMKGTDIAKLTPVFERLPSEVIREYAQRHVTLGTTIKDGLQAEAIGGDLVASLLTIGQTEMVSEKGRISTWIGTDGAAIFKNGAMVGTLDVMQMRAVLWLQGNMRSSLNSIQSPTDGKTISFLIQSSKAKIKPYVKDNRITYTIQIEAEDDVLSSESSIDLKDPQEIDRLEARLAKQLQGRIIRAIQATTEKGVDAFGFGRILDWHYPKLWKKIKQDWRDVYPTCKFDIDAHIYIRRTGTEKNSLINMTKRGKE
jgi:spore germination protein KC